MNRNRIIPILLVLLLVMAVLTVQALAEDYWVCDGCGKRVREIVGDICPYCGFERHAHEWQPATCVSPKTCAVCGETEGEPDPAHHTGETVVRESRAATCREPGYTGDICCAACGRVLEKGQAIPVLDHRWDEGAVIYPATCRLPGITRLTCTVCGKTTDRVDPADPARHAWDEGQAIYPATCIKPGLIHYTCTACGAEKDEAVPADPDRHAETELRGAKEATCTETGSTGDVYCRACGRMVSAGSLIPATGHIWQPATCTSAKTCQICGATEGTPINHDWQPATKGAPKTCRVCGKTEGKPLPDIAAGDIVTFGHYEQDNDKANGPEAIEWQVLEVDEANGRALLISKYGLDVMPYNQENTSVTWAACTLRGWLNKAFLETAFTKTEQGAVLITVVDNSLSQGYSDSHVDGGESTEDSIFLLSYAEAKKYFRVQDYGENGASSNKQSRAAPTAYAKAQGAYTSEDDKTLDNEAAGWWWLRSPGTIQNSAAYVDSDGSVPYYYVNLSGGVVRPALWINLASDAI